MSNFIFLSVLCFIYFLGGADGHGRLVSPPGRSSMWKYGFNTPENYNDNQLYCGGFENQQQQGGRCGLCGDPYQGPRENEAGGKYATEAIAKCISTSETTLDVSVQITANHLGYFEFKLCENNDFKKNFTQECLDKNLLKLSGSGSTKYYPGSVVGYHNFTLQLPVGLTCDQCVLQWRYHTGNSWGMDKDGKSCVGCGPQEEFYACSDIKISNECTFQGKLTTKKATTEPPTTRTTTTTITTARPTAPPTTRTTTARPTTRTTTTTTARPTTRTTTTTTAQPTTRTTTTTITTARPTAPPTTRTTTARPTTRTTTTARPTTRTTTTTARPTTTTTARPTTRTTTTTTARPTTRTTTTTARPTTRTTTTAARSTTRTTTTARPTTRTTTARPTTRTTTTEARSTTRTTTRMPIPTRMQTAKPETITQIHSTKPTTRIQTTTSTKPTTKLSSLLTKRFTPSTITTTGTEMTDAISRIGTKAAQSTYGSKTTERMTDDPQVAHSTKGNSHITPMVITTENTKVSSLERQTTKMSTESTKDRTTATTMHRSTSVKTGVTFRPIDQSTASIYKEKDIRICISTLVYADDPTMSKWCMVNCNAGFCPRTHCTCEDSIPEKLLPVMSCRGYGIYADVPGIDIWCQSNCLTSSFCPRSHCTCTQASQLIK